MRIKINEEIFYSLGIFNLEDFYFKVIGFLGLLLFEFFVICYLFRNYLGEDFILFDIFKDFF